ncbi:multiple cyclophane-containing RiPP AmcA [Streptomyces xanthochromogenes]|uniref:multiple cyclophane-containing RiPP AmcA n=1 Tax=Streptomyces xanthochromogenes TaxID=67384 RepID=UPI0034271AD7
MPAATELVLEAADGFRDLITTRPAQAAGKFDNRPTWANTTPAFDNRPTWDNWHKK